MVGHVDRVFFFSLTAGFDPTLLATTVMLLLPKPKRLLLGYLLGALLTSITLGLLIVFSLEGSGSVSTAQNTLSPASDLVLGGLLLVLSRLRPRERSRPTARPNAARARRRRPSCTRRRAGSSC